MTHLLHRMLGVVAMSFELPTWAWPVTLLLSGFALWSAWFLFKNHRLRSARSLLATSLIAFIGFPAYAVAYWAERPGTTPETQELPTNILGVLWWGYVLLVVFLIVFSKGRRIPMAGLGSLFLWLNFAVFFVCIMAVSGVWL